VDNQLFRSGFLPEEDKPEHWIYEDRMFAGTSKAAVTSDRDLREFSSPVHKQNHTSSCVAQSVAKALEIKKIMRDGHENHRDISRLALYYLARTLMFPSEVNNDRGTHVSLCCDVLRRFGVCEEEAWPWDPSKVYIPPSWLSMRRAYVNKIRAFCKIKSRGEDRVREVARCIQAGNPVVFGTEIDGTWHRYKKGKVLRPIEGDRTGKHATVLLGIQDGKFIGENSWGKWGDEGFYLMAPEVISSNQAQDFWVIVGSWEPELLEGDG